jgi:hypothetical protein
VPNIQRAKDEFNLKAWITLPDAIRRTLNWIKNS